MPPLSASQVAAWRRDGVLIVADALRDELLLAQALELAAAVELGGFTERALGDGTAPRKFPYEGDALNSVSLHPRLLAAAAQLLGEGEHGIRLTQATLLDPARGGPSDGAADHAACHLCVPLAEHPEAVVVSLASRHTGAARQAATEAAPVLPHRSGDVVWWAGGGRRADSHLTRSALDPYGRHRDPVRHRHVPRGAVDRSEGRARLPRGGSVVLELAGGVGGDGGAVQRD